MALLTVAQLRAHVETDLDDTALQAILDSEEGEIVKRYGAHASATELLRGGERLLFLTRPAASITSVTEEVDGVFAEPSVTVLAADDYRIWQGGRYLERLTTGTNPRLYWGDRVTVVYTPADETAQRTLILVNLCKLAIRYTGADSESVGAGDYSARERDYAAERTKLLRQLAPRGGIVFA